MLVDYKRSQVIVRPAVLQAVLIVWEYVNEVVAAMVTPRYCPLPRYLCVVLSVLAAPSIPAFEISGRIYDQARCAKTVSYGLGGKA